jgi:hypothetical protein
VLPHPTGRNEHLLRCDRVTRWQRGDELSAASRDGLRALTQAERHTEIAHPRSHAFHDLGVQER